MVVLSPYKEYPPVRVYEPLMDGKEESSWSVIWVVLRVEARTVSENVMVRRPMFRSRSKETNDGEIRSTVKLATCKMV